MRRTKEELAKLGWDLWEACGFQRGLNGVEVSELVEVGMDDPLIPYALETPDGQIALQGLVRWAGEGFPTLVLGHKYTAALLATQTSKEAIQAAESPWEGFVIEVPKRNPPGRRSRTKERGRCPPDPGLEDRARRWEQAVGVDRSDRILRHPVALWRDQRRASPWHPRRQRMGGLPSHA